MGGKKSRTRLIIPYYPPHPQNTYILITEPTELTPPLCLCSTSAHARLSLIFEVDGGVKKIAGDSSCCSEVNMLVLYQRPQNKREKFPVPGP